MFETYTTDAEINGVKYTLKPLSGAYLGKLLNTIRKFQKIDNADDKSIIEVLDEETISNLYAITLETFKKSYPAEPVDKLESFVTQNLFKLIEPVMKVNIKA